MIINTLNLKKLRKLAEKLLQRAPESTQEKSTDNREKIVHELQVHQIELEIQNEELRKTRSELEDSRNRYHDLYDFAPIGYLTLDENGFIQEINLTGAELFGIERRYLMKAGFSQFIVPEDQDVFYFHRQKLFETGCKQTCELKLMKKDGTQFFAQLQCTVVEDDKRNFKGFRVTINDISRIKAVEDDLRLERDNLINILDSMEDGVYIVNRQNDIEYVNPILKREFGVFEGKKCYKYFHDRTEVCPWCKNQEVFAGKTVRWEWYSPKNKKTYDLIDTPLKNPDGSISKLEIFRDITELKCIEEKLQKKSRDLTERVKELKCLYSISNLVETEGISIEQMLQGIVDLIPHAFRHPEITCARIILKDKKFKTENFNKTQWKLAQDILVDGDQIGSLEVYCLEKRSENKEEVFFLKEEKDLFKAIAERLGGTIEHKRVEEELSQYRIHLEDLVNERTAQLTATNEKLKQEAVIRMQTEDKYRNLMENATDAILLADDKGNLIEVNKKAEILLGYTKQELINMNITRIHPKEDLERTLKVFKETQRKGEGELINGVVLRKDGKRTPVDIKGSIVKYGDKEVALGIFRDITFRKKTEEEIQKMEKLEAIGVLAGGIAHDFNNLLTGILGNLSMAELYIKPQDRALDLLAKAKRASINTGKLTKQLLTFSKGGAPVKDTASISELIKDTVSFSLRGSNVKYKYTLPDNLWPVEINEGQISQVINNLIINADQAMPQGGIIRVSAENVIIEVNEKPPLEEGKYIRVSVKDQGPGIPEEHLSKIFDPYFTTKENGSGLGLASCYSIVKNHGGYITVATEIGAGTTFHMYLPASKKEVFKIEKITEEIPYLGTGKILLMDDEQEVIDTVKGMLLELGYEVDIAKNGTEAIELYKKAKKDAEPFVAVILDLTIPGNMGGQETIRKLRKIDPDVKAIVSSGYSNNPLMAEYEDYGFKGVVAKPYEINELSKVLYKMINGKEESSINHGQYHP